MSESEFQGKTHEELYAMVANGKPERLTEVGKALKDAFDALDGISKDLKEHVARVKLDGEGGDAFRKWGEQMVMQTTKLAHYTSSAGAVMTKAGEGLAKAQSQMPKPSTSPCLVDAEKEKARMAAAEKDRQAAVDAMRLVDSYYTTAGADLGKLEEPRFALPAELAKPISGWESPTNAPGGASKTFGTASDQNYGSSAVPVGSAVSAPHNVHGAVPSAPAGGGAATPNHGAVEHGGVTIPSPGGVSGTTIDSTAALPPVTTLPPTGDPTQGIVRTADPADSRRLPMPMPGQPFVGNARTGPPAETVRGRPGLGVPGPQDRLGPSDGVVGGLPSRPRGESAVPGLPRGVVVGAEPGAGGRGSMGMGGYPGPSMGAVGPGGRPARQPGGIIGTPRVPGSGSASALGSQTEFTSGGSGLVRGAPASAPLPPHTAAPSGGTRRSGSTRPAFVTEDKETWNVGRRDTVPPVVE